MNIPFDPTRFYKVKVVPCSSSSSVRKRRKKSKPPKAPKEPNAGFEQYSQFTLFPKLPPEVRARIWYFAVQSPRVVEVLEARVIVFIINYPTPLRSKPRPRSHEMTHFRSKTSDPPLLSTCHESRQMALRLGYKKSDLANEYCPDAVYFECSCDTMYLTSFGSSYLRGLPFGYAELDRT
jgi:hypothetical protein